MRLLHTTAYTLTTFFDSLVPPYVILSHTWGPDEVSFQDIASLETASRQSGFLKIKLSCAQGAKDGFEWIWIDTCCIDKTSSAELSEAINSMFKWYQKSAICYAFLEDVSLWSQWEDGFRDSKWFRRGWTLQELVAPRTVEFYDMEWNEIGTKRTLQRQIAAISGINYATLGGQTLSKRCVAERLSWAARRQTTREEDEAYCLMGIFEVNMPIRLYGEGGYKAFSRLQEAIMKISGDYSLFAWRNSDEPMDNLSGLLSVSPIRFKVLPDEPGIYSGLIPDVHLLRLPASMQGSRIVNRQMESAPLLTSKGLDITLARGLDHSPNLEVAGFSRWYPNRYFVYLNCRRAADNHMLCIQLLQSQDPFTYSRVQTADLIFLHPSEYKSFIPTRMYVWALQTTSISNLPRGGNRQRVKLDYHIRIDSATASDINLDWLYTQYVWDAGSNVIRSANHDWQHNVSRPAAVFQCQMGTEPIFRVAFGIKNPHNEPWCAIYVGEEGSDATTCHIDYEKYERLQKWKDEILYDRDTTCIPSGVALISIRTRPSRPPDLSRGEFGPTRVLQVEISLRSDKVNMLTGSS